MTNALTPDFPSDAAWEDAWAIVRRIGYTGPITVSVAQGVPVDVAFPGPVTRIRLTRGDRKAKLDR